MSCDVMCALYHAVITVIYSFQACDITGGLYLKIPQKVALAQYLLVRVQYSFTHLRGMGLVSFASNDSCFCCLLSSGCSCLTPSSGHSWCCRRLHMWTTELRVSATVTSLKSVTCAQFVCPVSLNCLRVFITGKSCSMSFLITLFLLFLVFCNFSPICTTCE